MGESKPEEKVVRSTWIWYVPYCIILSTVLSILTLFIPQPWASGTGLGPSAFGAAYAPMPWLALFFVLILLKAGLLKKSPNKVVLAYLYIASLICAIYTTYKGFYCDFAGFTHARLEAQEITGWALPYFWMPSAEAIRAGFYPNSVGNFFRYASEWGPVLATWIFMPMFFSFFVYSIAIILRRLWVDIESLPFTHAQGWVIGQLITGEADNKKYKIFMAAFIIALLFMIPYVIIVLYPPFPDIYGWLKNPLFCAWSPGGYYAQDAFPFLRSTIVAPLVLQTNPIYYCIGLLAPLDVLFSAMIGWLVLKIALPQILYYMGYYTGALTVTSWWGKPALVGRGEPLKLLAFSGMGIIPGVIIFNLALNWRYIVDTFRLARRGGAEGNEYRLGYVLLIVSIIFLIPFLVVSNLTIASSIVLLWVIFLTSMFFARAHAYAGIAIMSGPGESGMTGGWFYLIYGSYIPPGKETADQLMALTLANWSAASSDDAFGKTYGPAAYILDCFKVGRMAGLGAIDVIKAVLIATIIAAILAPPVTILTWHYFGLMVVPASKEWNWMTCGQAVNYNDIPAPWPWWPHALAGFITAAVLSFLRLRYVWWPLEPLGLAIVTNGWNFSWWDTGPMFTICWVIKYIILKVGGRRLYEEYTIPALIGIMTGMGMGVLLAGIAGVIRFFMAY